jgi:ABC-type sugar transport system substrate-binding protein
VSPDPATPTLGDAEPLLALKKISKFFGPLRALHEVDFSIRAGEIQVLVGDNGAGKSTLVKTISGAHRADKGEFFFKSKPVTIARPDDTVMTKAREAGIPTLYGNGQGEDSAARDSFVGTDNVALGINAGELAKAAPNGKGKVGITAITQALNIQQRITGFGECLKANAPDIKIIATINEDGFAKSQSDAAATLLQAHPDVNLIYNTDDSGSLFIAQALKDQGLTGKVPVIGTNAAADQLPTLRDGEVYANVTQDLYAEEWISLHFLFWMRNKMTTVPDTCYGAALVVNKASLSK